MTKQEIARLAAAYPKIVEWREEDNCCVGRCPMLFGGGVHGQNEARVYRALCHIAEEWVELLHQDGTPLPPTRRSAEFSGRFMVRIDPALHQRLALKAAATGQSLNSLVAKVLTRGVKDGSGTAFPGGHDFLLRFLGALLLQIRCKG